MLSINIVTKMEDIETVIMLNILYVLGAVDNGGIEKLVANIFDSIDKSIINIDIAYHGNQIDEDRVRKFELLSSRFSNIYRIPSFNTVNSLSYRKWWKDFISKYGNKYKNELCIVKQRQNLSFCLHLIIF